MYPSSCTVLYLRWFVLVNTGNAGAACKIICGEEGLASIDAKEVTGAVSAIFSIMQDVPEVFFSQLLLHLEEFLNR